MSFAESQNFHEDQRLKCLFKIHVPCFRKRLFETNNSRRDIFHDIAFLINLHSWVLSLSNIENHCPNQETQFCPIVYKPEIGPLQLSVYSQFLGVDPGPIIVLHCQKLTQLPLVVIL